MTDVTMDEGAEPGLSAADEQLLRAPTGRSRRASSPPRSVVRAGGSASRRRALTGCVTPRPGRWWSADVPLVEVAQVLRYHSLPSTAIYARVDLDRLAAAGRAMARERAAMSTLTCHVGDYLAMRRALDYKLERADQLLPQLVSYLEARGAVTINAELAIAWARVPEHATLRHEAQRLAVARGFAPRFRAQARISVSIISEWGAA